MTDAAASVLIICTIVVCMTALCGYALYLDRRT